MIRCGIIGLGRIGTLLEEDQRREKPATHAGAMVAHPSCTLVGGYDIDSERCAQFSARWGVPANYSSAADFLTQSNLQILSIATHPDSHRSLVSLAVRYRIPVVICEKPLADTLWHARSIMKLHQKRQSCIIVNHERRYAENWQRARRAIHSGDYGTLISIRATLCFGATKPKNSVLVHDGTHLFDLLNFLVGAECSLKHIVGQIQSRTSSAYIFLEAPPVTNPQQLDTDGISAPIPCVVEIGAERDYLLFEIECHHTSGRITIGNGYWRAEHSIESPYYEHFRSLDNAPFEQQGTTGYFTHMIDDAVRCVTHPNAEPISSAIDAYRVMKLLGKIGILS